MTNPTKFGEQPAREVLRARGLSIAKTALLLNVTQTHLHNAVKGLILPNEDVRRKLPEMLGEPLEKLFTKEVLTHRDQRVGSRVSKSCGCVCEIHSRTAG